MKKFWFFILVLMIIPVFAYEVYTPNDYDYKSSGDKLLFVIDFSNSMGEYLQHETKVKQVKDMMAEILPQIDPSTKTGVRVYGHTCNILAYNACRSSELLVPLEMNNSSRILSSISKLRPRGMTPITYSLKQAVKNDFLGFSGQKHIILLTDGGENCDESPCTYVLELIKMRKDITIDVIAFNVNDEDDLDQLECTSLVTSGKFYNAKTAAELVKSLNSSVNSIKKVEAKIIENP